MKKALILLVIISLLSIGVFVFQQTRKAPVSITIYTIPNTQQGITPIYNAIQAVKGTDIPTDIEIYPPTIGNDRESITFTSPEVQNLPGSDKDNILREIAFLQNIQGFHNQLEAYTKIRIDNIETDNWESLAKYAKVNPPTDLTPKTQQPPEEFSNILETSPYLLIINDELFDISDQRTIYQIEQKLIQTYLRQGTDKLSTPSDNPLLRRLSRGKFTHQDRFEAYTNLDCDDKSDQVGEITGFGTSFQRCEYVTPSQISIRIEKQNTDEKTERDINTISILLNQIFKNTEISQVLQPDETLIVEPPKTREDQEQIPFQIILDETIVNHPKYLELASDGIIEEIESKFYINAYRIL